MKRIELSETLQRSLDAFLHQIRMNTSENPATTSRIVKAYKDNWNVTIDEDCVKAVIKVLRNEGHLICSSNKGYYYGTQEQAQKYLEILIGHRDSYNATISDMAKAFDNYKPV